MHMTQLFVGLGNTPFVMSLGIPTHDEKVSKFIGSASVNTSES